MQLSWRRLLVIAAGAVLLVYGADYISIAYQIPKGRVQFGSIEVEKLLAVPQKNQSTEYIAEDPQPEKCAYSIFPQLGLAPCWYVARHTMQQVKY
jgi:hypothetical protein